LQLVHVSTYLPVTDRRFAEIRRGTDADPTLTALRKVILTGWPEERKMLPAGVSPHFDFRDELAVIDGVVMRGDRVVIPHQQRAEMIQKIHQAHSGINGCLRRAREALYWPGMSTDVKEAVSRCSVCRERDVENTQEPMIPHDIIDRPWAKVGSDLFVLNDDHYLVTVDYFSGFFEVDRLQDTTAATVIRKMKKHFARYGSPEIVVSDNGPQFTSEQFAMFSRQWDFDHRTSSPGHPSAN
jgi:predicted Fe-S protein YdhL (DUF1289 family)